MEGKQARSTSAGATSTICASRSILIYKAGGAFLAKIRGSFLASAEAECSHKDRRWVSASLTKPLQIAEHSCYRWAGEFGSHLPIVSGHLFEGTYDVVYSRATIKGLLHVSMANY
jgi:hypothetical protein